MGLRLITPPTAEPVSLVEAKRHLRVEHSDDDDYIAMLVTAARQTIDGRDGWLGRALMPQTWEYVFDAFPAGEIRLPFTPIQSIAGIFYDDTDGLEQTVDPAGYYLDNASYIPWVMSSAGWPTSTLSAVNAVRVRFVAGYENAAAVPAPIRHAILLMVGHWYMNREAVTVSTADPKVLPMAVDALLTPYRVWA